MTARCLSRIFRPIVRETGSASTPLESAAWKEEVVLLPDRHYIADDLGIPRDYWYRDQHEPPVEDTWLDDADLSMHLGVERRLHAEVLMDELDA